MRLGSFWGLTAPMALLVFDGDYETLYEYLDRFNSEINTQLVQDIRKEFIYLYKRISSCSWNFPEYTRVSERLDPDTEIVAGKVTGLSELEQSLFVTEVTYRFLEMVQKYNDKGDYRKVPSNIRDYILKCLEKSNIPIGRINKALRAAVEQLEPSVIDTLVEVATSFELTQAEPKYSWWDGVRYELNENQRTVWRYFHDRQNTIEKCIQHCSGKVSEDELIFGYSFFDLIKRKPISVKYLVMNLFKKVKDRRYAKMLPNCIETCQKEINRYRDGIETYVDFGESANTVIVSEEDLLDISKGYSSDVTTFFMSLIQSGKLSLNDLKRSDLEMLFDVCSRIKNLSMIGSETLIGVNYSDYTQFIDECCQIGICGINDCSIDLLADAITNTSLAEHGKIKKSAEDLSELVMHLHDINDLLQTLIPIGTNIG